jgi:hypothetical protein
VPPPSDNNSSTQSEFSLTATLSNIVFNGIQETFKAAEQIKEFVSPEDLQTPQTDEEVI